MMYLSFISNTTGDTSGAETAYSSGAHEFTTDFFFFLCGSWISIFSFLCIVFHIVVCLFVVVFFCAFVLSALLWCATSYCPFGIAKLSFFPAETTTYFFMKVRNVFYNIYSYWVSGMCIILF